MLLFSFSSMIQVIRILFGFVTQNSDVVHLLFFTEKYVAEL